MNDSGPAAPLLFPKNEFTKLWADYLERESRDASDIYLVQYGDKVEIQVRRKGTGRDIMIPADLSTVEAVRKFSDSYFGEGTLARMMNLSIDGVDRSVDFNGIFFRANMSRHSTGIDFTLRRVADFIPDLEWAKVPRTPIERLYSESPNEGLVLVSGSTGDGKSTTMAAAIDAYAKRFAGKSVVTLEDPIEYKFPAAYPNGTKFRQREVGRDVASYASALRRVVRQCPDVIVVGEIRDKESAEIALNASMSGHLVFTTVHAGDVPETIGRYMDFLKPELLGSFASAIKLIISQKLKQIPNPKGKSGDVSILPIHEVLINSGRTSNLRTRILECVKGDRLKNLHQDLETGQNSGMMRFKDSIRFWRSKGMIPANHILPEEN